MISRHCFAQRVDVIPALLTLPRSVSEIESGSTIARAISLMSSIVTLSMFSMMSSGENCLQK